MRGNASIAAAHIPDMTNKLRHPAGTPASHGGEYKAHNRPDSGIGLDTADHQAMREDAVLDQLGIDRFDVKSIVADAQTAHIFLNQPHTLGGYDEIRFVEDGAISYLHDGKLHRNDGFAINWRGSMSENNNFEAFLNGKYLPDPAPEFGLNFQGIRDGVQVWSSGNNEVDVDEEGSLYFYRDGDQHREGAPAVVRPNGDDEWWIHDKHIPSPQPKPAHREERYPGLTQVTGASFEEGRDIKDVAVHLRDDLKAAQYAGVLPHGAKINVTIGRAAKSRSVNIDVQGIHRSELLNPSRDEPGEPWYTPEGERIVATLNLIGNDYNRWTEGPSASPQERTFWLNVNVNSVT